VGHVCVGVALAVWALSFHKHLDQHLIGMYIAPL
jgi:hypothetical protein